MNAAQPNAHHPIFSPLDFHINTPMIVMLQDKVTEWLWCGHTGGYIIGRARIGKSRAIRNAAKALKTRDGEPIPTFFMNFGKRDRQTIAGAFRTLKRALGLKLTDRTLSDEMSDDLVLFLAEASLSNHPRYVVLVIDEVQRATLRQLYAFAELYDMLVDLHTQLFVLFVMNTGESDALLKRLKDDENEQLRGRFFNKGEAYYGLRTHQEVQHCLREYDRMRYPELDGPTITEYFLPQAFQTGWRLETLSTSVWRIYTEEFGRPLKLTSWGMQYFTAAMKTLLVDFLPEYGIAHTAEVDKQISRAIEVSGIVSNLVEHE